MKTRESGMPDEKLWSGFFNPEETLIRLGLTKQCRDAADFGCGYGTFTIPAARLVSGVVYALDIEPEMIAATTAKARAAGLTNVLVRQCDFVTEGTGLDDESVQYVMLFNILHAEEPLKLLSEVRRILAVGGQLAVMHWNYDPTTPRGPSMTIRPRPEQCLAWAEQAGFRNDHKGIIDLPPYHYGWLLSKR